MGRGLVVAGHLIAPTIVVGVMNPQLDLSKLRLASLVDSFPYSGSDTCFLELTSAGVSQPRGRGELRAAAQRAESGDSQIIAAWPGQWRTDAFLIDKPVLMLQSLGVFATADTPSAPPPECAHRVTWIESGSRDAGAWQSYEVTLHCGCKLTGQNEFAAFAAFMKRTHGWHIAGSVGWSGGHPRTDGTTVVNLRALRSTVT